jgi:hypothetical protein
MTLLKGGMWKPSLYCFKLVYEAWQARPGVDG